MKNTLSGIEEIQKELNEIGYFNQEVDPIIEKLVNDFIEKAVPDLFPHYVDNDENDGQLLRVQLTVYFHQQILALLDEWKKEIIGKDETWKFMDGKAKECQIKNQLRQQQRAILDKRIKEFYKL